MADKPSELEYWTDLREQLSPASLARIDFDELDQRIERLVTDLPQLSQSLGDLAVLREEFEMRLAGMLKAIAAVERSRTSLESATCQIEQFPSLSAAELLKQHRATSARFRDLFPGSVVLKRQLAKRSDHTMELSKYK